MRKSSARSVEERETKTERAVDLVRQSRHLVVSLFMSTVQKVSTSQ